MPGARRISLLALVLASLAAGCGSDDTELPEANAERMLAQVEGIQEDVDAGRCNLVPGQAAQFATEVESLPSDVDEDVRGELREAASRLVDLASQPGQCVEPETGATGAGGVEPITESEATTTETIPTTTETETAEEPLPDDAGEQEDGSEDQGSGEPGGGNQGSGGGPKPDTGGVAGRRGGGPG